MKNARIISLITAVVLLLTFCTIPAAAEVDVEGLVKGQLASLREAANDKQEEAIKAVEAENALVAARSYTEAPWSNILTGTPALLTDAITEKQTSVRTLTLEYLRGKEIAATVSDAAINEKIAEFKTRNDAVDTKYNLDDVSISESAAKYSELEAELTGIYALYLSICREIEAAGGSLNVDNNAFEELDSAKIEEMFSLRITNLFKDINALIFAGKDTWESAYKNLLSGENKITMGLILGSEGAAALADTDAMQQVYDYVDSTSVLSTVAGYQADLYSSDFSKSNTALYSMLNDIFGDILSLSGMAPVKEALDGIGWSAEKVIAAMKIAQDAADKDFYSRAVNLNIILGKYLGVYKEETLQNPVVVAVASCAEDEYDICVEKGSYKASIINVLDTAVYNADGTLSSVTTADDEGKLVFSATEDDIADGYTLGCYRDGAEKNVYNYIAAKELEVVKSDVVRVESVTIVQGSKITVYVGQSTVLEALVSPNQAANKTVTWTSDKTSVATVGESSGRVMGVAPGTAIVTVTTADGGYTATIEVTVRRRASSGGTGSTTPSTPTTPITPITPVTPIGSASFTDLAGHWAAAELDELIKSSIVSGCGDGTFRPDRAITRAEFAKVICNMMGIEAVSGGVVYSDTADHWAKDYIAAATKHGYMIGVAADLFAPDLIIPREQAIAVILRAMTFSTEVMHEGSEITYTAEQILNLVKEHFGYEYTDISAEVTDINTASDWAKAYVEMAYKLGHVKGYGDNTIRPLNNATRAEAIIMAKRVIMD